HPGYCSTGGEELRLKERVCFRKTRRGQGKAGDRRLHPGYCSTGGEEQQLKEHVCFRKTRRVQGNGGERRPHPWAILHRQRRTAAEGTRGQFLESSDAAAFRKNFLVLKERMFW
ncbi:hypothetical protein, partial [Bacillus amyloliquefaciens]|uniref:hypothetical protein n=1 Tax=Bacillus amyloliquefaciens TaxID=1390 RepID=UPI001C2F34E2